jgi:hypothetical protein
MINIEANQMEAGTYGDTVSFTNSTNGNGTTTRAVGLKINPPPSLAVTPANKDVSFASGVTTFDVANLAGGTMGWVAAVISESSWLSILSGSTGSNNGTITVAFTANQGTFPRQGVVRVTAAGAVGSPKDVTVTQAKGSLGLQISAQRTVEKAWLIQREYGTLTITVDNPALIPIGQIIIYRKTGAGGYQNHQQISGSSIQGNQVIYHDTFLQNGVSYTYKVVALDVQGTPLGESAEVTI